MDSSDLRYLFEDEDGSFEIDLAGDYYGEIDFQMQYKAIKGTPFDWLYVDFQTLSLYAADVDEFSAADVFLDVHSGE